MVVSTSGPLYLSEIQTEFGGTNPIYLGEYFKGGSYVPSVGLGTSGIPSTGTTTGASYFRGKYKFITVSYAMIGGGGGGGAGDGASTTGSGSAPSGGNSTITGTGMATLTASGAAGGGNGNIDRRTAHAGQNSDLGTGGYGGNNNAAGGNASGYGAGGGGGGGNPPGTYERSGNAGSGGQASANITGTFQIAYGTTLSVVIGGGGAGGSGSYAGGSGSGGKATLTWSNGSKTASFTANGTRLID
jgi:hypothetical protein